VRAGAIVSCAAALACACASPSDREAMEAVRSYDDALMAAYRSGDASLVEPFAGPDEAKKLLGLVGAKLDMGITLDAELVQLEVLGVERRDGGASVRTREVWRYADRKVGTGAPVGEASEDHYEMSYRLGRSGKKWVVEEVSFASPPKVGRKQVLVSAHPRSFHGDTVDPSSPAGGGGNP